jgi:hypothetical protein
MEGAMNKGATALSTTSSRINRRALLRGGSLSLLSRHLQLLGPSTGGRAEPCRSPCSCARGPTAGTQRNVGH